MVHETRVLSVTTRCVTSLESRRVPLDSSGVEAHFEADMLEYVRHASHTHERVMAQKTRVSHVTMPCVASLMSRRMT